MVFDKLKFLNKIGSKINERIIIAIKKADKVLKNIKQFNFLLADIEKFVDNLKGSSPPPSKEKINMLNGKIFMRQQELKSQKNQISAVINSFKLINLSEELLNKSRQIEQEYEFAKARCEAVTNKLNQLKSS